MKSGTSFWQWNRSSTTTRSMCVLNGARSSSRRITAQAKMSALSEHGQAPPSCTRSGFAISGATYPGVPPSAVLGAVMYPGMDCRKSWFSPASPKSPIFTTVIRDRSATQKMLSGLRSACTIRFRWMCRTLSISGPKASAASEKVRSGRCSQARSVKRSSAAAGRLPPGGASISSISMSSAAHIGLGGPRPLGDWDGAAGASAPAGRLRGLASVAPAASAPASASQMKPPPSLRPPGVGQSEPRLHCPGHLQRKGSYLGQEPCGVPVAPVSRSFNGPKRADSSPAASGAREGDAGAGRRRPDSTKWRTSGGRWTGSSSQ
mmetsp:Transcript_89690/g.254301  ORF Transcript_89690/g.254301 Transcript_89690/m.254301 type:complete len:319 (-) Transcript_89690:390-1346(-)